ADAGETRHASSGADDSALLALKTRIEARMKEGELLAKIGRLEEALDAYRSVGEIYDRGMVDVRALVASLRGLDAQPAAPARPDAAVGAFRGRAGARREREAGGDVEGKVPPRPAERTVDDALRWLAAHQSPNGSWEAAGFVNWCDGKPSVDATHRPDGQGKALHDVGVTGLAMMAFLGAGYTNRGKHPYAVTVSKAARYLKNVQDPEGCFGPRKTQQYIYGHATASLAMIELYAMTQSPIFKGSAQKALDFIALSRNPYFGWRYGVKPGDNDTSVTTWMVMCLKSAMLANNAAVRRGQEAPLRVDGQAFAGARAWLDKVTDPEHGRVGYVQRGTGPARAQEMMDRFPSEKSESMTAAGMLARIVMGEDPATSSTIQKGAQLVSKVPPVWNPSDGSIDMYYWYYGTLAMFQVGGKHWRAWSRAMQTSILDNQRRDTGFCHFKGSWDPIGPWGHDGGRVYSTALMCLCAQAFARYEKVHGTK
ncbi:MAG: terpene cyclase/mutase family protein, partial [Planctomycetota bacterium]|nr:terpene cyclase/mutase family protein [Planctomycetota bacterium]